jgi:hypothetical protein
LAPGAKGGIGATQCDQREYGIGSASFPSAQFLGITHFIMKSIKVKPKKRGRPATGKDPLMGFRASPEMRASVVRWAENQPDLPTLSEAIRRLVELGLTVKVRSKQGSSSRAETATAMASDQLDQLVDRSASTEQQANRKRRLLKGPEEFQSVRVDRRKTK